MTGFVITTVVGLGTYASMRWIVRMGGTRLSGLIGGVQTQPAVLAFANERTGSDPRVALGYAMVYPVAMIGVGPPGHDPLVRAHSPGSGGLGLYARLGHSRHHCRGAPGGHRPPFD